MRRELARPAVRGSVVAILFAAAVGFFLVDGDADTPTKIGYASSVVTLVGALLAVYIFAWSRSSATETTKLLREVKDGQQLTAALVSESPGAAPEGTEPQGPEPPTSACVQMAETILEKVELKRVPIRVLAEVVDLWRREDGAGKWAFSDLEWIARSSGKGNHPWMLRFSGDDDLFRVAYGGAGRKGDRGLATRHPAPADLAEIPCP
jgi:hypothetical protein